LVPAAVVPFLIRRVGPAVAQEMLLTGERFGAVRARAIGLVGHVVPDSKLDGEVMARLGSLLRGAPGAQRLIKETVRRAWGPSPEDLIEAMVERAAAARVSEEGREGIRALLDQSAPPWVIPR
jgi:methylglutaconyl-CoA hydratase